MSDYTLYTRAERPELDRALSHMSGQWPRFIYYEDESRPYYGDMEDIYSHLHFYLCDESQHTADEQHPYVVLHGQALGLHWSGDVDDLPDGWSDAVIRSVKEHRDDTPPNTLCGVSTTIAPDRRGEGLGSRSLKIMRKLAANAGLSQMIVPVRPALKPRYPLIPMDEYITWTRADGLLFDHWLRTHQRLGAEIATVAPQSMRVTGTVAQWEKWTDMTLPASGQYIIKGGLTPLTIDHEKDMGLYIEPNVWMVHPPV
jgi:GNAT superfamily N-acetyltransferase